MSQVITDQAGLRQVVERVVAAEPVVDMHTHLYPPSFGSPLGGKGGEVDEKGLMLWGVDELVTYHYLIAELFRVVQQDELTYEAFYGMPRGEQADLIWQQLFVDRLPMSEACRGVLTVLSKLGLDPNEGSLEPYRRWFAEQEQSAYIDRVMELAGVTKITMTNNVFDDEERERWLADESVGRDDRFDPVLRFDALLDDWPHAVKCLNAWGYEVSERVDDATVGEVRRFLVDWIERIKPVYAAVSLPPSFEYGPASEGLAHQVLLDRAVLPVLGERGLPFAMMIGVRRAANPPLRSAGDTVGPMDIAVIERICAAHPGNQFMVTLLSRENQHGLCVAARKFGNLMPFGCWWFLNNPSIIREMTDQRLELLGSSFVPQHSDARILDQLIYKWSHSRALIADSLTDVLSRVQATGLAMTEERIRGEVSRLLRGNYLDVIGRG